MFFHDIIEDYSTFTYAQSCLDGYFFFLSSVMQTSLEASNLSFISANILLSSRVGKVGTRDARLM